jgi:hypothetical protein
LFHTYNVTLQLWFICAKGKFYSVAENIFDWHFNTTVFQYMVNFKALSCTSECFITCSLFLQYLSCIWAKWPFLHLIPNEYFIIWGFSMLGWYPWPALHSTVGLLYEPCLEGRHMRNWHCCCQSATQLQMPQYQTSKGSHLKTSWWRYEFRLPELDDKFNILTSLEPNIMIPLMSLGRTINITL